MKVQTPFCILTRLEWILWGCSLLVVTLSFLLSGGGVLSLIASLIGVTALIFLAKGHVLGQILTVVFSVLYGMISWRFHYYGEMLTYLGMTMPIAAWSVYTWLKHPYAGTKEVAVRRLSGGKFLLLLFVTLLVTIGAFFLLRFWSTPNLLASTLSIATSFLAASLALLRSPYYAIAYSCNDIVLIVLWILAAIDSVSCLPMVFCFGMFLFNDIYGFVSWRRMERRQATAPTDSHTVRRKS